MSNFITVLDIGSSYVKGVVAEIQKDGTLAVVSVFREPSAGFRKGVLVDFEAAFHFMRPLILDLQKISKKAIHNIFVNFNGEHIKVRSSRAVVPVARADQEIQQDDMDKVLEASKAIKTSSNFVILHNIVREYIVDDVGDIQDPLGMTGNRLEVNTLIVEAFAPHIHNLTRCLEKAGGRIGGIIFNPLAAGQVVLSKKQKDLGSVVIDFGVGTTSFAAYEGNKVVYTKSVPLGFSHVTNDIAIGLRISIEAAEKILSKFGSAFSSDIARREMVNLGEFETGVSSEISRRFLAEIIEVRLAEILDLVNNELKNMGRDVQLPAGAFITGGSVKLPGLVDLVREQLKLPCQIAVADLSRLEILNPTHREMLEETDFSVAAGLLSWANEKPTTPSISGFQDIFKKIIGVVRT